ncbi:MAG: hypothetical protein QNJ13_14360 [Paracoccaceae bacterium]|nr:hypothetical protein [Paracoccaceae bacterium]
MKAPLAALAFALSPLAAPAAEIGTGAFFYVTELVDEGFTPFATSGAGNAVFGMTDGTDLYLCFIADTGTAQAERQRVLMAEIEGQASGRQVPNIPVICVETQ